MFWEKKFNDIIESFKNKNKYALAKMITLVENNPDDAWKIISKLPKNKSPHIIGITGSPGAGKSTMVSKLVEKYSEKNQKIGIIAVDPSSPFTGGAFLGDRIRMRTLNPENVYIRSVASRGSVGGLCDSIFDIVDVMSSYGFDKIIIETVGAGQSEIEVVYVADTILLVMSPDSGDEVQMFKAGIMEIADSYIVNKIDLQSANRFLTQLKNTLNLEYEEKHLREIFGISAIMNKGLDEVIDWIDKHKQNLYKTNEIENRIKRRKVRRTRSNIIRKLDYTIKDYKIEEENLFELKDNLIKKLTGGKSND